MTGTDGHSDADYIIEETRRLRAGEPQGEWRDGPARYVVIENTPGYMPDDDDPATFEDETDARVYASDLLSRLLDHIWEGQDAAGDHAGWTVSGSFQEDWSVLVTDLSREHDLGRIIEIVESEGS
jgi:hypothetical protein